MRRIWHYLTQKTKPLHTGSFMWFAECEKVTDIYKKIATKPSNQTHNAVFHGLLRQGRSSETQAKQNTVSFAGQLFQKLAGFPLSGWELTTSLHPVNPALFFSVGWQKVPAWAGQQPPSKGWCLTHRIGNFSRKRYFSSTGLEVLNICNQCQLDLSYRVMCQEASSSCLYKHISLTCFEGTAIPVWTGTRWHSKSHIASKKGSGEWLPDTLLPLPCITLITGHHSVYKKSYGNHF